MFSEATTKIIGHVGKIEVKTVNDTMFAAINIATNERWTDRVTGKIKERTDWHRAVTFQPRKVAMIQKHISKGDYLVIDGKLRSRSYDHNGETRHAVEVEISGIGFLSPKASEPQQDDGEE